MQILSENFACLPAGRNSDDGVSGLIRRGAVKNLQQEFAKCSLKDVFQHVPKSGGGIAGNARKELEKKLGRAVISKKSLG